MILKFKLRKEILVNKLRFIVIYLFYTFWTRKLVGVLIWFQNPMRLFLEFRWGYSTDHLFLQHTGFSWNFTRSFLESIHKKVCPTIWWIRSRPLYSSPSGLRVLPLCPGTISLSGDIWKRDNCHRLFWRKYFPGGRGSVCSSIYGGQYNSFIYRITYVQGWGQQQILWGLVIHKYKWIN